MAKVSDVIDVERTTGEPVTTLPERGTGTHEDIKSEAYAEGELEATIDEIASMEGELTADDLRRVGGADAEGLTDEELLQAYKRAEAAHGRLGDTGTDEATKPLELPFPVYDAQGNKVDPTTLTLEDLVSGKVQIGYNAMGKEQRKAFNDILRVAANGHLNESKMATTLAERNQSVEKLRAVQTEHEAWAKDRKSWTQVLDAAANGNVKPLEVLIRKYAEELGRGPTETATAPGQDDQAMEQAGHQYFMQQILPITNQIAQDYGADASEVANAVLEAIQNEPSEFFTKEKLDGILQYDLPALLEQNGYSRNGSAPVQGQPDLAETVAGLQKEILALKAGSVNATTAAVRGRNRNAPPAGGGSVGTAGDSAPSFKNREQMKKWLRNEEE